jgi:hypothetical protein
MAKKKTGKRPNVSSDALERARRELYGGTGAPAADSANVKAPTASPRVAKSNSKEAYVITSTKHTMTYEELASEYGYVLRDLRSMARLAGVLFVAMIVVSLLIDRLI